MNEDLPDLYAEASPDDEFMRAKAHVIGGYALIALRWMQHNDLPAIISSSIHQIKSGSRTWEDNTPMDDEGIRRLQSAQALLRLQGFIIGREENIRMDDDWEKENPFLQEVGVRLENFGFYDNTLTKSATKPQVLTSMTLYAFGGAQHERNARDMAATIRNVSRTPTFNASLRSGWQEARRQSQNRGTTQMTYISRTALMDFYVNTDFSDRVPDTLTAQGSEVYEIPFDEITRKVPAEKIMMPHYDALTHLREYGIIYNHLMEDMEALHTAMESVRPGSSF